MRNKLVQNTKLNVTFVILIFSLYLIKHSDIASPFQHIGLLTFLILKRVMFRTLTPSKLMTEYSIQSIHTKHERKGTESNNNFTALY